MLQLSRNLITSSNQFGDRRSTEESIGLPSTTLIYDFVFSPSIHNSHEIFHINNIGELTGRFAIVSIALSIIPRLGPLAGRIRFNVIGKISSRLATAAARHVRIRNIILVLRRRALRWKVLIRVIHLSAVIIIHRHHRIATVHILSAI